MLALLLILPAFGKDPCKVLRTGTDPSNGPFVSYVQYFDSGRYTALDLIRSQGAWTMHLTTVARGASEVHGAAGDLARISVGNDVIEFRAAQSTAPVSTEIGGAHV